MNYLNLKLFGFLIFCSYVSPTPLVIKSAVTKSQGDEANQKVFDENRRTGIANYEGEAGFNKDNEQKFVSAADTGRYAENSGINQNHLDQKNYNQNNFHQNNGGHTEDVEKKGAHKKGHHKSGFHNSYYKDESGSNSSYYDDGEDEGGEYVRRQNSGSYGDAAQNQLNKGHLDSSQFAQDQARRGQYDNSGRFQKDQGGQRNFDRRGFYDNRENALNRGSANNYGGGERYAEEQYANRAPFHPIPNPYQDRAQHTPRHITIYEDPRYIESGPDYIPPTRYNPRYDDDYVQLDIRHRGDYYDNRPLPPDYYY